MPGGLPLIEFIASELDNGKLPLYSTDSHINESEMAEIIDGNFSDQRDDILNPLLQLFSLLNCGSGEVKRDEMFEVIFSLSKTAAIKEREVVFSICRACLCGLPQEDRQCPDCGSKNFHEVSKFKFADGVKKVLKNNQFLEIYAKECMKKEDIEPIGWNIDNTGKKAYTSITYQIDGEPIEIDAHGIANPISLILVEVKTQGKIVLNDLRRMENLYDKLMKKVNERTGRKNSFAKIFIISGQFDTNIPVGQYRKRNWEFIDGVGIPKLKEELKRMVSEL